jgi:hypothetical protein
MVTSEVLQHVLAGTIHTCTHFSQRVTSTDPIHLFSHYLSSSAKGSRCICIRANPPPHPITTGYGVVLGCWCSLSFMIKFSATGSFSQNFREPWSVFVSKQRSSSSRWGYCHILVGRSWFTPLLSPLHSSPHNVRYR